MPLAGKQTRADGRVYVGEFKDDKYNGKGEEREGETERSAGRGKTRGLGPSSQAAPTGGKAVRDAP